MQRLFRTLVVLCLCVISSLGGEISGIIKVDPKLSRKSAIAAVYDLRGRATAVNPQAPANQPGIGRVAVWLEGNGLPEAPGSEKAALTKINQRGRRFEPDMLIVPVGSKVSFPNLDPIFHNIFSLSKAEPFDLGFYAEGKTREVQFTHPGIVQIYCHVHPEMYAVVVVTPNTWATRPGPDGTFSWNNVPPGKYRLEIWQRSTGLIHRPVTVQDGEPARIALSLPDEESE
jgi:plastocyanin